jgi:hypothetical protein
MVPATGFHPLWLLSLLPFFARSGPGALVPVGLTLALGSVLALVAAVRLERLARRLTGRLALSLPLALAFGANLWVVRESLNGLETALCLALLALLIAAAVEAIEAPSPPLGWRFGLLGALCIWARSDSALIVGVLGLVVFVRIRAKSVVLPLCLPPLAAVGFLVGATTALTGRWLQSSASAVPWLVRTNWHRTHPGATAWDAHRHGLEVFEGSLLGSRDLLGPPAFVLLSVALLVVAALAIAARGERIRAVPGAGIALAGFGVGLLALHVVHGYVRWYPRSWYFVAWALAAYALAALAAGRLAEAAAGWRAGAALPPLLAALLFAVAGLEHARTLRAVGEPQFPWQAEMLAAGRGLATAVPEGATVGSFNAAIIGYASERTVVNLDGVVNDGAFSALRERRLGAYLRERGIGFVVDYPTMWSDGSDLHASGPYLGPEFATAPRSVVERFDVPGVGWPRSDQAVTLIRIDWDRGR